MLIQFRFKNFKSFKDDSILDMSAAKITEHADRVIKVGNEKLLPAAAIFGANACGKSNIIEAFKYMTDYVRNSLLYGNDIYNYKSDIKKPKYSPFLFDEVSQSAESSFEVYFIENEINKIITYNYGFTLNKAGVVEEWLNSKAKSAHSFKSVFYRNGDKIDLSGISKESRKLIDISLEKEVLIVSLAAKLKIAELNPITRWFFNINFPSGRFTKTQGNNFKLGELPKDFALKKSVQEDIVKYFSTFDDSIIGFYPEVVEGNSENYDDVVKIETIHRDITGNEIRLPLEDESDGTLKMMALYPALQETLKNGGVMFVDELNAQLHPLLVRAFLIMFLNPEINVNQAQLVFTTHDSWQLANNILRRDEIWFVEKGRDGASSIYSLADFTDESGTKIRKDENYEKNYLLGKYGAIPIFSKNVFIKGQ